MGSSSGDDDNVVYVVHTQGNRKWQTTGQDAVFFNSQPAKASLCTVSGSSVETQSVIIMSSSQLWGNVDAPREGGGEEEEVGRAIHE